MYGPLRPQLDRLEIEGSQGSSGNKQPYNIQGNPVTYKEILQYTRQSCNIQGNPSIYEETLQSTRKTGPTGNRKPGSQGRETNVIRKANGGWEAKGCQAGIESREAKEGSQGSSGKPKDAPRSVRIRAGVGVPKDQIRLSIS